MRNNIDTLFVSSYAINGRASVWDFYLLYLHVSAGFETIATSFSSHVSITVGGAIWKCMFGSSVGEVTELFGEDFCITL